ncbi:MAG: hypothetical protein ACFFKA_11965 [Candidatus Thorarchaeota archaeon]
MILSRMGFDSSFQQKFLDLCHHYGGHYDCEILLNASRFLIKPNG